MRPVDRLRNLLRALRPDPLEVTDGRMTADWHAIIGLGRVLGSDEMRAARERRKRAARRDP